MFHTYLRAGAISLILCLGACALGPQDHSPYLNNVPVNNTVSGPTYDMKGLSTGILLESGS